MVFLCGTDRDYDTWRAQDNPGWDYNSLLPYFKKFESNKKSGIDKNYHGTEGPLGVGDFKSKDPFIETFRDGYSQLGYNANSDFNAREYNGYVKVQGTIDGGERFSAARAFLLPVKNRPNLTIMKGSIVEKVLFNGTTAIGVKVVTKISECSEIKIYARKEIILSAGAIGTPKILLKSGIGRSADLDPFEIEQVKDLAVGQNYNDHPKSVHFVKVNPDAKAIPLWDQVVDASNYILSRTGTFSYVSSIDFNLIINTTDPKATYPDIFLLGLRTGKAMDLLSDVLYQQGFKQKYIDAVIEANKESEILLVYVHLAKPVARGTVKLRSKSVWEDPIIVTDWYTHSTDINTSVRGIKKLEELIETDAFKKVSAKMIKFDIPECNPLPYPSDDYRKCYLRYFTASAWHQSGTAKMGPITDPNAVVDSRLRVHGIKNLRVVDASIMPDVITTNTQCPTYMIGEKGADMIKQEYQ